MRALRGTEPSGSGCGEWGRRRALGLGWGGRGAAGFHIIAVFGSWRAPAYLPHWPRRRAGEGRCGLGWRERVGASPPPPRHLECASVTPPRGPLWKGLMGL